jgi:glucose/arabinose dehydrogenase
VGTRRGPHPSCSAVATLAVALGLVAGCGGEDEDTNSAAPPPTTNGAAGRDEPRLARSERGPRLETVATGLEVPWEIAFLRDGRALITERPGRVRILSQEGRLEPRPAAELDVAAAGEGGLLGLAIDPKFDRNRFVYLYLTTESGNQVRRYRLDGDRLSEEATIVEGIQAGAIHDGGRIHFGPDDRLYMSTGEIGQGGLAQDPGSLNGKFLRLDPSEYRGDGGDPDVVSIGHRNPQGFDWQPDTDRLFASEHGPEGDDEVNVVREGGNYGWPDVQGEQEGEGLTPPVALYEESIAPSGATFVSLPGSAWTGDFLIGALVGEQVRRLSFEGTRVTGDEALFEGELGRVRTVVEGPDGALYVLTSNRDGRGNPEDEDDRVVRIVPPAR